MRLLTSDYAPVPDLLELAKLFGIEHDGSARGLNLALQRKWYQAGKLRVEIAERHADQRDAAMRLFRRLELIDAIRVAPQVFRYALLLGATVTAVRKRLNFLRELWDTGVAFQHLIMLGGERPLIPDKEGSDALLKAAELPFKAGWSPPAVLPKTEDEMMRLVIQQSDLPTGEGWRNVTYVNTPLKAAPEGESRNPNAEDTVKHWLNTFKPLPGSCLAVSSQPFVAHQTMVAKKALGPEFTVSGCGYGAPETLPVTTFLDCVAKQLYEEVPPVF